MEFNQSYNMGILGKYVHILSDKIETVSLDRMQKCYTRVFRINKRWEWTGETTATAPSSCPKAPNIYMIGSILVGAANDRFKIDATYYYTDI